MINVYSIINKQNTNKQKKELTMKIQIPFYQTLDNERVHVTFEFECPEEPEITGGKAFFDIRPVTKAYVLKNKSTECWKRYFDAYTSHDKGYCVHVKDIVEQPLCMGLPKKPSLLERLF